MIRRLFFGLNGLCLAGLVLAVGLKAGPAIEGRVAPIRGPQSITAVERSAHRVCWTWTFVKLRGPASTDLDAFLEINGEPSGVAAPFDLDNGYAWGVAKLGVTPRPQPYSQHFCDDLPPVVQPSDAVRIRQTAFYLGWMGLWRLAVPFPDVVSEGVRGP